MKTLMDFDHKKSVQALNYLAQKEGGKINKMKAIKLIWLADRSHLRRYGHPITNDAYFALKYGPIGSSVKDLAECSTLSPEEEKYVTRFIKCDAKRLNYSSVKDVDLDVFSEAEQATLDSVYSEFGSWSPFKLADFSHKFPEWKKFEAALTSGQTTREVMTYSDFFKDAPRGVTEFFSEDKETLKAAHKEFEHNHEIASFWL